MLIRGRSVAAVLFGPVVLAVGLLLATTSAGAGSAPGAAQAIAVEVVEPGQAPVVGGVAKAPPDATAFGGSFADPGDGSIASAASTSSSASVDGSASNAAARISTLSLFGGEITADAVTGQVQVGETVDTSGSREP
jgi:hypothetical protein